MKALVVNAVGGAFDFEDVEIAGPIGREVAVDVRASGLCHTDMLFATNPIFPTPAVFGHESVNRLAVFPEDLGGADFVEPHEPRVARHVSSHYRRQPASDPN